MKVLNTRKKIITLFCTIIGYGLPNAMIYAQTTTTHQESRDDRFPIGCTPVGAKHALRVLSLFPQQKGGTQSMYLFFNKTAQPINLYHMQDATSEYSVRLNHALDAYSWAALAIGEPEVRFACALNDKKTVYGTLVDCANTVKVCQYVHVKFGMNNTGNFWIVNNNTRNGAVSDVVHYGIIPGA